jgi:periodic tryptophan protein 2
MCCYACRTVRTWDVYDNKAQLEILQHQHDVLALAWRPDGKLLASATLDGQIYLWNAADAVLEGVIEGRRDIKGGRLAGDRWVLVVGFGQMGWGPRQGGGAI